MIWICLGFLVEPVLIWPPMAAVIEDRCEDDVGRAVVVVVVVVVVVTVLGIGVVFSVVGTSVDV